MVKLNLKVVKVNHVNPSSKEKGYSARVITNGTASYDEIVEEACHNTTLHKAEAKMGLEVCMEAVATMLKQGYIVDLGPVGKLYPSCSSGWVATAEELQLSNVVPSVYYRPADEVAAVVKGAKLQWAKSGEVSEIDKETEGGTTTTPGDGLLEDQP